MVPVHRDRAADAERDACDHQEPQPADIDAEALRRLLAEAERAKGVALAPQNERARHDERQRQHDMAETAILQRAEQPERDFEHHEGIAGQVHHQRGRSARQARDRKSRQNQNQQSGIAARDREQRENRSECRQRSPRPEARRIARRQGRARSPAPRRRPPIAAHRTARAAASGLRSNPCKAAPDSPRIAPIANPRIVRGSRISRTITCCTSLPPPNSASITVSGDSRTGPIPSETSASSTTSTTSAVVTPDAPARRDVSRRRDVLNAHHIVLNHLRRC